MPHQKRMDCNLAGRNGRNGHHQDEERHPFVVQKKFSTEPSTKAWMAAEDAAKVVFLRAVSTFRASRLCIN